MSSRAAAARKTLVTLVPITSRAIARDRHDDGQRGDGRVQRSRGPDRDRDHDEQHPVEAAGGVDSVEPPLDRLEAGGAGAA